MKFGKTIAVLGCGLNRMYPKENEWLFHKILANGGCIISEYKQDVEAAKYAKEQEKTVYAVPSNIDSITGVGTNLLIMEGATLVTKPSYIKKDLIRKQFFKNKKSK